MGFINPREKGTLHQEFYYDNANPQSRGIPNPHQVVQQS